MKDLEIFSTDDYIIIKIRKNRFKEMQGLFSNKIVKLNSEMIKILVSDYFQTIPEELDIDTRVEEILIKRQIAHYLSCKLTEESMVKIGSVIGQKDSGTVLNSKDQITKRIETNKTFYNQINEIEKFVIKNYKKLQNKNNHD